MKYSMFCIKYNTIVDTFDTCRIIAPMSIEQSPDNLLVSGFSSLSQTANPDEYRTYLENVSAMPQIQAYKNFINSWIDDRQRVVDVGCGTGSDLLRLH